MTKIREVLKSKSGQGVPLILAVIYMNTGDHFTKILLLNTETYIKEKFLRKSIKILEDGYLTVMRRNFRWYAVRLR